MLFSACSYLAGADKLRKAKPMLALTGKAGRLTKRFGTDLSNEPTVRLADAALHQQVERATSGPQHKEAEGAKIASASPFVEAKYLATESMVGRVSENMALDLMVIPELIEGGAVELCRFLMSCRRGRESSEPSVVGAWPQERIQ